MKNVGVDNDVIFEKFYWTLHVRRHTTNQPSQMNNVCGLESDEHIFDKQRIFQVVIL